jgi:transcriptional regulator with GAF, ATPase, and Fis domain
MYAEISAALASAKTALDLAKAAKQLSDFNNVIAAVAEVNTKLMDATVVALASLEKQSALSDRVAELEDKQRQLDDFETQIQRYKLHEFAETKALVYALQPSHENGEPLHYLCATCLGNRKKTILQPDGHLLRCHICDISLAARNPQYVNPTVARSSWMNKFDGY